MLIKEQYTSLLTVWKNATNANESNQNEETNRENLISMTELSCKHKGKQGQRLCEHEIYSGVLFTDVHFTAPDSHIIFRDTMIECLEELRL